MPRLGCIGAASHDGKQGKAVVGSARDTTTPTRRGPGIRAKIVGPLVGVAIVASIGGAQLLTTSQMWMAMIVTFLVWWLVGDIMLRNVVLAPVRAITQVAHRTALGERTARVRSTRTDELGQLSAMFDSMLDELVHREECERDAARLAFQAHREAEAALAEVRCHKFALDQHAIVAVTDPAGRITYANDRLCEISKYAREELIGQDHRILNSGRHAREFWRDMWRTVCRGQVWRAEVCNRAKDGTLHWLDSTIVPFKDSQGRITQYVAIRADITQRKVAEQQLLDERARLAAFVEHAPAAIAMFDQDMRYVAVSRRFLVDYRLEGQGVIGRCQNEVMTNLPERWSEVNRRALAGETLVREEGVWRPEPEGDPRYLRWEARPWRTSEGTVGGIMTFSEDISSLKLAERELIHAARLDKLTGLPNRGLFLDRLQQAMARARRTPDQNYAVMFLDCDRFKIINDSLGHTVGDALLVGVATRLRDQVRDVDSVSADLEGPSSARLGGDEFVVLLDGVRSVADVVAVADRLLHALAQPYQLGPHEVYSTASIGIVIGDPSYACAEDVVRDADTAMYESKRLGRSRYTLFDASMRQRVQRHLRLESELRKAIGTSQLWLTYQPIVSLSTGAFVGVEALMRWRHPVEGQVEPTEFIPIAEESDLILTLGHWALSEACRQFVAWQHQLGSLAPRNVSINVSRRQFALADLPQTVGGVMRETGIDPSHVQLELTEDAFVCDIQATAATMRAMKSLGVQLAIDDFGMGTSSFASLHDFPVDVLKIHRSMMVGIEDSRDVASLIHGLAVMVKNMGIDMVAEGVETPAQLIALQELGCDFGQGFFFAPPLTAAEVLAFATRNLSLTCSTRGAAAYANQWHERLPVFHPLRPADGR